MSYNWGPHFFVPTELIKKYRGRVVLRETYDEELLGRELEQLGMPGSAVGITNLWFFRRDGTDTWIKTGESSDQLRNFAVPWDTTALDSGEYEILGIMNVRVKSTGGEFVLSRHNVVGLTVEN
jgi:hypothetical protein